MGLLNWDKLKKPKTSEEYFEQELRWKAKLVNDKDDPRVEIRKTFYWHNNKDHLASVVYSSQVVITIRLQADDNPNILISGNGKMSMSFQEFEDIKEAISEATNKLTEQFKLT